MHNDPIKHKHGARVQHPVTQVSDSQLKRIRQYNDQKQKRKAKVVVYSANLGGRDRFILPEYITDDWDYVLFTDAEIEGEHIFEIRKPRYENTDPKRTTGYLKTHPHEWFPEYEYSVWVDACIQVKGPHLESMVKDCIQWGLLYMGCAHSQKRKSIYEVLTACILGRKDDPMIMAKQVRRYIDAGYPDNLGILESGLIIRNHNTPHVMEIGKAWWEEIQKGSKRDQLSLMYIFWKHNFKYEVMENAANPRTHDDYRFFKHAKKTGLNSLNRAKNCQIKQLKEEINRIYRSRSWRYTAPLRRAITYCRGLSIGRSNDQIL
ncbi:MAG: DUF616 domain-containing protein [Desulfobacterales bacterium]|nr:DUF616 domain-containing protein [Desulfobacterales bacterium]